MSRFIRYARILLGYTPDTVEEYEDHQHSQDVRFVWFTALLSAFTVMVGILSWRAAVDMHRENKDQQRAVDIQQLKEQDKHNAWLFDELQQRVDEIEESLNGSRSN